MAQSLKHSVASQKQNIKRDKTHLYVDNTNFSKSFLLFHRLTFNANEYANISVY